MMKKQNQLLFLLAFVWACGGTSRANDSQEVVKGDTSKGNGGEQRIAFATPFDGPNLLAAPNGAPIGYVAPGTELKVETKSEQRHAFARIGGGLMARGWIPERGLGTHIVEEPGKLRNSPVFVNKGSVVTVTSQSDGIAVLEVYIPLGERVIGPYVGEYPSNRLTQKPVSVSSGNQGVWKRCAKVEEEVRLYQKPDENAVSMPLPPSSKPCVVEVLKERAPWSAVRFGHGPYLVGYVNFKLVDGEKEKPYFDEGGERPWRINVDSDRPLVKVATGARVNFRGTTIGILRSDAWARQMGDEGDDGIDVFVAADNRVALRGLVSPDAVKRVEAGP